MIYTCNLSKSYTLDIIDEYNALWIECVLLFKKHAAYLKGMNPPSTEASPYGICCYYIFYLYKNNFSFW